MFDTRKFRRKWGYCRFTKSVFWIIGGATDLYNSKEEIGYSVSEVVHILSESLSVNCKESKTLKQIFETALLEVKDEIGLNSYELTEYSKMK